MASFDATELQLAERAFLADADNDDLLGRYYLVMVSAGEVLLRSHARDIGLILSAERLSEISHDAFTRLLEYHRKHPDREVPASARMFQEVRYQLHNRSVKRREFREVQSDEISFTARNTQEQVEPQADPRSVLSEVLADAQIDGRRVVVELFDAKHLKRALRRISGYVPRPWIYEHAAKLKLIFEMTRGRR